jgi:tetratricopeptide (TPR) repeat protein/transcriptional regulator with XRE-family HTH domain
MAEARGEFAGLLRELRTRAGLTQEGLAAAARLSHRTVSDLERGLATTPQRGTVRLLADALSLIGLERARFETAARGRPPESESRAAIAATARSLPLDVASFTGRQRELDQLAKAAVTAGGVVSIHAIGGMAGVGKTAFAVHAGHQLAGRFPGGQVFLPLHGHTPGRTPVAPADALGSLLLAIGVPPAQVPPGLEARAALWRDQVAGRALLLVLDDAAGSEQVQPLLPGAGGSLVLVTSRRHLSALDDATSVSLDTLPPGDAAALLVRLAGRAGLGTGDPGVREISRLCGYLPLAVGLMARQLRQHPAWSAADRAAELAAARDRLELMETDNLSVAAAFDLSYAQLTGDQQRLFRRIGLHPGPDVDGYAAAALDGTGLAAARRGLEALYDQYLLTEPVQGRYQPHDLIREHARSLAGRVDLGADRDAATARLLDYYQQAAAVADARINRRTRPGPAPATGMPNRGKPAGVPALANQEQALAWSRSERTSLLACLDHAVGTGQLARVIILTAGVSGLLRRDGPWAEAVARHTTAIGAAQQLGDPLGQANVLAERGDTRRVMGNYTAAVLDLEAALVLYRDLSDRLGQANVLSSLGDVWHHTGDYPAAAHALEEALSICRDLGDRLGQAQILVSIGSVGRLTGDYPAAAQSLEEALGIYRDLGDRLGQANVLSNRGDIRQLMGDHTAAVLDLEEALGLSRDLSDKFAQASALSRLGSVRQHTGDYRTAVVTLEEALAIWGDLGDRHSQANTFTLLGGLQRLTGDYPAADQALEKALVIFRDTGDRSAAATVLNERGTLHRVIGDLAPAKECHRQSLELSRELGILWDEAHALAGLGRCALADGDATQAEALLRQALEIFRRIGAAEAQDLATELGALTGPRPPR